MIKWIFGNWKMFGSNRHVQHFSHFAAKERAHIPSHVHMGIAPPALYIPTLQNDLQQLGILLGSQNCSAHPEEGSFTGQISAQMLKDAQVDFVIIGHSECRTAGETENLIAQKVKTALEAQLNVILCVGETLDQLIAGQRDDILTHQITKGLSGGKVHLKDQQIFLAYEPVWAIGTGRIPEVDALKETLAFCRALLNTLNRNDTPLLYGGSVTPDNIRHIFEYTHADGVLVGKASLQPEDFFQLARNCP